MVKITLLLLCAACGVRAAEPRPPEKLDSFPKSTVVIENGSQRHSFEVWVADTTPHRAQGLMFVRHLPNDKGMLFVFDRPGPVSMWMKNTYIPLDMLFIAADGRIVRIAARTRPHSLEIIESFEPATAVLEIAGGEAGRLGIESGDYVRHPAFDSR